MMSIIRDWLGALFYCRMLDFEQGVLKAVASQMTGEDKVRFEKQLELIEKVDVDPFKTCFRLIMGKESARCERIDVKDGLILSRVHGVLDERPLTAEVGLCDGLLYGIVVNRPLSRHDRSLGNFRVVNVCSRPKIVSVGSEWEELILKNEKLLEIEIRVLRPEERWLHPWNSAWYVCLADICSQYYILQKCDNKGELCLLDYINDEIVLSGGTAFALLEYAYSQGHWIEDRNALKRFMEIHMGNHG